MDGKDLGYGVKVNNGKGLFDNEGLCDSLANDLNNLIRQMISGNYIQFCATVTGMGQKLINLKKGIADDMNVMKRKVEELKNMNDSLVEQMTGLPVEKDGASNDD
jgi:hypothetical protein